MNGIDFRLNKNIYLNFSIFEKRSHINKDCEQLIFVSQDEIMQYTINPPDVRAVNVKRPSNFESMQYQILSRLVIEEFCIPVKLNSQSTKDGRLWG